MHTADLNLLRLAASLYRHQNVSKAARALGLSQSAVSHALARLRAQFGDPMFVRTSKGMAATEFARSIQSELMAVVHRADLLVTRKREFDPLEATGRITLATTDYFECVAMPRLQSRLSKEAPLVQLSLRPTQGELPKRELEEGRVDLAIAGFYADLPEGFYQKKLFSDGFACATRKGHPRIRSKLGIEEFYRARHAMISLQGDLRDPLGKSLRKIVYGSYSFTGIAWVLTESDLVLTAPRSLLEGYRRYFPITLWPCPVEIEPIDIRMVWHAQTHENHLMAWFRGMLGESKAVLSRGT